MMSSSGSVITRQSATLSFSRRRGTRSLSAVSTKREEIKQRSRDFSGIDCSLNRPRCHFAINSYHRTLKRNTLYSLKAEWKIDGMRQQNCFFSDYTQSSEQKTSKSSDTSELNSSNVTSHEEIDVFGESVTFFKSPQMKASTIDPIESMALLDDFQVGVISLGSNFSAGKDEDGDAVQASHSSAIAWAALLRRAHAACDTQQMTCSSPMLVVTAVVPMLAQTGLPYLRYLDRCLARYVQTPENLLQLEAMANCAIQHGNLPHNHQILPLREQLHLKAMEHLLNQEPGQALKVYLRLLNLNPADVFALCLCIEICQTLGETRTALHAACSVARYHAERQAGQHLSLLVNAWVALGIAVGSAPGGGGGGGGSDGSGPAGQSSNAELMALACHRRLLMSHSAKMSTGVASWALSHVYDSGGRMAEGVSALLSFDGVQFYRECGWLNAHAKLAGYGARFILDRDGQQGGNAAMRIYDEYFHSLGSSCIEDYGNQLIPLDNWIVRRAPQKSRSLTSRAVQPLQSAGKGIFDSFFGKVESSVVSSSGNPQISEDEGSSQLPRDNAVSGKADLEDILTCLPPTPQLLAHATLLLLRLTFAGVVSASDERWASLRHSWIKVYHELRKSGDGSLTYQQAFCNTPFYGLVGSLLLPAPSVYGADGQETSVMKGLRELGELLNLGQASNNEIEDRMFKENSQDLQGLAKSVVINLSNALPGRGDDTAAWTIEWRPILEHGLCHAAVASKDYECLSIARSVCSESVTLRPNSPETWWRYSMILEELGDENAAEDARQTSVSFGSGVRNLSTR